MSTYMWDSTLLTDIKLPKYYRFMYWTLNLAIELEDAPWPSTKDELIDYAIRTGCSKALIENLRELEDTGEEYESVEEICPDIPSFGDGLNLDDR